MDEHRRAFGRLNSRQAQAVKHIDGPVLVIAGPGTGKTELLSARVANILKSTDTKPQNILCLTFTNKAAINMKSRIIQQVGASGARVAASTFHSFAAEVMNLYPDNFWRAARLSVAPEAVQLDTVESIVSRLPLDNPLALKFAGQYTLLTDIQRGINLTKKAGLTPEKLRSIINFNLAYIDEIEPRLVEIADQRLSAKNLKTFQGQIGGIAEQKIDKLVFPLISLSTVINESLAAAVAQDDGTGKSLATSQWKNRWIQNQNGKKGLFKERQRNLWWLELASVYDSYRQLLHGRGFYDFDDMIVEVISQLEQNPSMLADIQERFSYVLIDEFQDTTPAQLRLAHLVADHHSAEGKPNLMAVGDDDQSIYKFNGAELNNLLNFRQAHPTAKVIVLTENYRSSQELLETAKKIIEQAETRVVNTDKELNKDLVAKLSPKTKGVIKAVAYSSRELQLSMVARDIKKNYSPKQETAVLARSHDSLIRMAGLLQQLNVPVRYEQASNILEHEFIRQVYWLMRLLGAIQEGDKAAADSLVHRLLRWPGWGIEPHQLWQLAIDAQGKNWLDSLLGSRSKSLKSIGQWFLWLAKEAGSQPLAVTLEQIIGLRESSIYVSPIRQHLLNHSSGRTNAYLHDLSAIQLLRAMVLEFASGAEPTIADFVRFMEVNLENNIVVADESPFITGAQAVQLLTVHKAKGLEFDSVYLIDVIDSNWLPKAGGRKPPSNLPLQPPLDELDDYIRLMYVAATRAKSSLIISAYNQDHNGKDVAVSSIVQAAMRVESINQDNRQVLIEVLEENLRWPELEAGDEKQMLTARLETYSLYATHLLDFLDVTRGGPQYFKERHLLRLPQVKTDSMSYGSAMHAALEHAQQLTNVGKFSLKEVEKRFANALKDEQRTASGYKRYLEQGKATLNKLFRDFGYQLPKGSIGEQIIRDVSFSNIRIGGTIDRLDRDAQKTTIVDYKTGQPLSSFETEDKTKAVRAYKHKMQLIFYALLLNIYSGTPNIAQGKMVYLETENLSGLEKSYSPTAADIDHMTRLITAVWGRIMKLELPDVSSYSKDIEGIKAFEKQLISEL